MLYKMDNKKLQAETIAPSIHEEQHTRLPR